MVTSVGPPEGLVALAANGWTVHHYGTAAKFVGYLKQRLGQPPGPYEVADNILWFDLDLSDFRLRGVSAKTPCLLLAGSAENFDSTLRQLWKRTGAVVPFIFCVSEETYRATRGLVPPGTAAVLSTDHLVGLLQAEDPRASIKANLWRCVGRRRLNPYTVSRPAEGNMFFGREEELELLRENFHVSYAIAGPGQIGKTSLLKRYRWDLMRRRDPHVGRVFYVDLYDCPSADSTEVLRHIARQIDSSAWSRSLNVAELSRFLRHVRAKLDDAGDGHARESLPIELLLDEVDAVCHGEVFELLGDAARRGLVRLVMCGRRQLLKTVLDPDSVLHRRVRLLRPRPVTKPVVSEMILRPMADLGLCLEEEAHLIDHVFRMTGGFPQLVQYYAGNLVDLAERRRWTTIPLELVRDFERDFETVQYMLSPVVELHDNGARELALALLTAHQPGFAMGDIQRLARELGQPSDPSRISDVCNEFVIQAILAWEGDGLFRLANGALRRYAHHVGFLDLVEKR